MTPKDPALVLRARLETELRGAMRARDSVAVKAVRAVLNTVDNAGAVEPSAEHAPAFGHAAFGGSNEVPRRRLTREEVEDLVRGQAEERQAAAAEYERLGMSEQAAALTAEAEVMLGCLEEPRVGSAGASASDEEAPPTVTRPR